MKRRKLLYWALWPVEQAALTFSSGIRLLTMLVIVTNPVLLTLYLLNRRKKREREDERI